ncbi:MAG TPA: GNAT family N-acetyltransferase [Candidatus Baltobacteraceae bacterium]|nr:GNAT family N-acetyltransferase [Candidatus Baltobacteraceae bacterium]
MVIFETERLLFRSHTADDRAQFIEMHTDPQVRRFVGGAAWSAGKARARFRAQYLGKPNGTYGLWAAVLKDEKKYIGCCGLTATDQPPHLAYYLARPYWGQGLASEAARAFVELGTQELRLPLIAAVAEEGNVASERILAKLGFQEVRVERIGPRNLVHYLLSNELQ